MSEGVSFDYQNASQGDLIDLRLDAAVTAQRDIQVVTITNMEGRELGEPRDVSWGEEEMQDRLETMVKVASLGRAEPYTKSKLSRALGLSEFSANAIFQSLTNTLPETIFWKGNVPDSDSPKSQVRGFKIGNFTVANALTPATDSEIEAKKVRKSETKAERTMRKEAEKTDHQKLQLLSYDHAVVTVQDTQQNLPLDQLEGILAARILACIPEYAQLAKYVTKDQLSRSVWQNMSLAERQLFTDSLLPPDKARYMYDDSKGETVLGNEVREMIESVLSEPTINDEPLLIPVTLKRGTYYATDHPIQLELHQTPGESDNLPTFHTTLNQNTSPLEVKSEHFQMAGSIVDMLPTISQGFGHIKAIEILDGIMSPEVKSAVRTIIKEKSNSRTGDEVIQELHDRIRQTLGEDSYWEALKQRRIANSRYLRNVRQSAGALQADTRDPGRREKTTEVFVRQD